MTPLFQCRGVGSTPGQRAKIPKAMGAQLKKKKRIWIFQQQWSVFLPTTCKPRCVEQADHPYYTKSAWAKAFGSTEGYWGKDDWVISANCSHLYFLLLLPKRKNIIVHLQILSFFLSETVIIRRFCLYLLGISTLYGFLVWLGYSFPQGWFSGYMLLSVFYPVLFLCCSLLPWLPSPKVMGPISGNSRWELLDLQFTVTVVTVPSQISF